MRLTIRAIRRRHGRVHGKTVGCHLKLPFRKPSRSLIFKKLWRACSRLCPERVRFFVSMASSAGLYGLAKEETSLLRFTF